MASKHVHRPLLLGQIGPDLEQLRYGINRKADGWGLPQFEVKVSRAPLSEIDLSAATHLLHAMGGYGDLMEKLRDRDVLSEYGQRLLRGSRPRTPTMLRLSRKRRPQVREWRWADRIASQGGFEIVSRAEWGARPPMGGLTPLAVCNEIFVHHTVFPNLSVDASVAEEKARQRDLQRFFQTRTDENYIDTAYHVLIEPSGRMYEGRPLDFQGGATSGRNSISRAICFDGNFSAEAPSDAAIAAARWACGQLAPGRPVRPHRAVYPTACPGKAGSAGILSQIRS